VYSSPVLYSSSLQDFLPNFPISDFLSATCNILIADCNSDAQSAVVMSKTLYPPKLHPQFMTACLYFLIKSTSTWSITFTSICIYVAMTFIQALKFMYEIQGLHGSADSCCGLLGWHHLAWYMNINIISEEHTAPMFSTKMYLDNSLLKNFYITLFTSKVSSFPLPDNHSQKSPMWHKVCQMISVAATIWYWQWTV
jgi:hypothetical protein